MQCSMVQTTPSNTWADFLWLFTCIALSNTLILLLMISRFGALSIGFPPSAREDLAWPSTHHPTYSTRTGHCPCSPLSARSRCNLILARSVFSQPRHLAHWLFSCRILNFPWTYFSYVLNLLRFLCTYLIQPQTCLPLHNFFSEYFQIHLVLSISSSRSSLFGDFWLALIQTGGPHAWSPAVVSGSCRLGILHHHPGPFLCLSLSLELLISRSHVSSFLGYSSFWSMGKRTWRFFICLFWPYVHMFNLPSLTGILSFMSEMKQLKFSNMKQLGSCQVGYFPCQSTHHPVSLSIFPAELRAALGQGPNRSCSLLHLQWWAHPRCSATVS